MSADHHVALIGIPGSGKSTVAVKLGELLDRPVIDFDVEIERRTGKTVTRIFAEEGEDGFRELERQVTRSLVDTPPSVLAPGGGWVTRQEVVDLIRAQTMLVWLAVTPGAALRRMGARVASRPLLMKGDPRLVLAALLAERLPYYEAADATVDTEVIGAQQVAERVAALASDWPGRVG